MIIIVTGANSGLGFEAAKEFAGDGAETILACRNMEKAAKALDKIKSEIPDARTEVRELDLGSLKSIRQFAEKFKKDHSRLDVLLNNAEIMFVGKSCGKCLRS
ncbi:MAG: SDR family NAD(P)-dependent oxidoreductase [Theionarchaea archaeon]|nr:SDR family NAD(P)-dependent oxidoreductase [Theionarchaea archaeon]